MQIFNPNSHYDFVGKNRIAVILSLVIILGGLLSLAIKGGPALGVDFAGGTLVEVRFAAPTQAGDIRDALGNLSLGSFTVQQFGDDPNDFLIRIPQSPSDQQEFSGSLAGALQSRYGEGQLDIRRMEMVGPQVGQELMEKGFLALLYAMAAPWSTSAGVLSSATPWRPLSPSATTCWSPWAFFLCSTKSST
ncbi:hypothetical protein [Geoalkalibacter halelectricus]|uniref:hypothetical protein n=1 Tax=Geoalkalibacter halelectricus TaxID=2847045 RepID=UPI00266EC164|nr:hypothetical protein [Geoalkalibacter halelectricus]MDO3377306.1 hypothetical protein [Geoalkalibacter halelectricus]